MSRTIRVAVVGAHLSGQPLNHQLTSRGGTLVETTTTSPDYRLFALDTIPPKPGLVRTAAGAARGAPIELEVWELGVAEFGAFVDEVPAPLGIGTVTLADGDAVNGFICEPFALDGAPDITVHGGWRAYLAAHG